MEHRLIAALIRFREQGLSFAEVGVARLVREAGIGRATFYLYFTDRSQFVLRLVDYLQERLADTVSTMWTAAMDDRSVLKDATREFLDIFRDNYPVIAAVIDTSSVDPLVSARLEKQMDAFARKSGAVLAEVQRTGVLRADLLPDETAATLIWMFERTCYQYARDPDADHRERLASTLASVAWYALHPDT